MMSIKIPFCDFVPVGVCKFSDVSEKLLNCRAKKRIPIDAKSVIIYLFPYYLGEEKYKDLNISRYAVPLDYHTIVDEYLEKAVRDLKDCYPHYEFEKFCDNSPIPEVQAASLAGLGVVGENGLLINDKYGSFVFIGEIVTDMELPESGNGKISDCVGCGNCKRACPGGALGENFNKDNCLSHITQKKGNLSAEEEALIKKSGCIWGCDICQNTCPMNKNISVTPIKDFFENAKSTFKAGDTIDGRAFEWRSRAVIERNFKIMCCKE